MRAAEKRRSAPRRPRRRGSYACGDETRQKIIVASLDVFGAHGFDGASTRMLAEKAQVSLPALQYYFDGKEGVYLACADYIVAHVDRRLGPTTARIEKSIAGERPSQQALLAMLLDLLDAFTDLFVGEPLLERWVLFMCREQAQPTQACDIIFNGVMRRVALTGRALVGGLLSLPESDPRVTIRTFSLFGQIMSFRLAREAPLRLLHWKDFDEKRFALLKSTLRSQVEEMFAGATGQSRAASARD